jgi:serine/threonine-protein kinase/endoribonuclease IRE1
MNPFYILSHFFALFLPFLIYLHASPAPDPYPAVVSLPGRTSTARVQRAQPTAQVEHDLLPFVIVSTIDGALHAIDRDKGTVKWTLRDGVAPLVGGGIKYIVEPLSGGLYVFEDNEDVDGAPKVRKLPLTVEDL